MMKDVYEKHRLSDGRAVWIQRIKIPRVRKAQWIVTVCRLADVWDTREMAESIAIALNQHKPTPSTEKLATDEATSGKGAI